jgi:ferredoxin
MFFLDIMIVTKKKEFNKLLKLIPSGSVYILGCSECATKCKTGGEKEVLQMKQRLEELGYIVTGSIILEPACHKHNSMRLLRVESSKIEKADHLLVLACGDGFQVVSSLFPGKHVVSGTDTLFLGVEESRGLFAKRCSLCGTCIAESFNGICPIGRCPKHMLNGPCGGSMDGHCEVSKEYPCVWEEILDQMLEKKDQYQLNHIIPPHNWQTSLTQQTVDDTR